MRSFCAFLFLSIILSTRAAEANSAAGDAAWTEILKAKKANVSNVELADQLKAFYKAYPDHPKASDAWIKEQSLRPQAPQPSAAAPAPEAPAPDLKSRIADALARIRKAQAVSPEAGLGEMERSGRKLASDFPSNPAGWEILLAAANGFGGEKGRQLFTDIAANAPTPQLKGAATTALRAPKIAPRPIVVSNSVRPVNLPRIKPISLSFTATDGRAVNLASYAGKVVLIDFWATWCGPCLAEVPRIKQTYAELHDQGFEIIGVSFDKNPDVLKKFVADNEMTWPQFWDGGGWENAVNKQFGITGIPAMYLVDKNGILRDENAREDLANKVRTLLLE